MRGVNVVLKAIETGTKGISHTRKECATALATGGPKRAGSEIRKFKIG
jgi:hypothetical protein